MYRLSKQLPNGFSRRVHQKWICRSFGSATDDHHPVKPLHTPEKLAVANSWPHEQFDPESIKFPAVHKGPAYAQNSAHLSQVNAAYDTLAQGHVEPVSFATSSIKSVLLVALVGLAGYRVYETLESNPFSVVSSLRTTSNDTENVNQILNDQEALADELVILKNSTSLLTPKVHRIRYDGIFERSSSFLNEFGSNVDTEGVKIKHTWEEYDRFK